MPDVQMNFDVMEEAANLFKAGADQMSQTTEAMKNVAKMLEDGALLGLAGEKLADIMYSKHIPKCNSLSQKFEELSGDLYGALVDLRDGDKEAASRFKG
jgi:hypothetical protein